MGCTTDLLRRISGNRTRMSFVVGLTVESGVGQGLCMPKDSRPGNDPTNDLALTSQFLGTIACHAHCCEDSLPPAELEKVCFCPLHTCDNEANPTK